MRGKIGIPALVVLLAAFIATPVRALQQPVPAPAQQPSGDPATQESRYRRPHHAQKGPVTPVPANGRLAPTANQAPAPSPAGPAAATPAERTPPPAVAEKPAEPSEAPVLKVVCSGEQITITAANTTLGNVLNEVKRCSGAQVDAPGDAYGKRIYDNLGPGPLREVLDALLSNSGYDYVVGASETNPGKVESILLMARNAELAKDSGTVSSGDPKNTSPLRRAFEQRREASRVHTPEEQAEAQAALAAKEGSTPASDAPAAEGAQGGDTPAAAGTAADSNAAPSGNQAAPAQTPASTSDTVTPPADTAVPPAANDNPPRQTQPSTTEQQIVNMEQMFQQRQQMIQQQNQPTPPKPQ